MMYLTLEEYLNMGGTLDSAVFDRLSCRASQMIKARTGDRMPSVIPESVKYLTYELISILSDEGNGIQSFSNDGVSVSFSVKTEKNTVIDNLMNDYLTGVTDDNGVPLLSLKVSYMS